MSAPLPQFHTSVPLDEGHFISKLNPSRSMGTHSCTSPPRGSLGSTPNSNWVWDGVPQCDQAILRHRVGVLQSKLKSNTTYQEIVGSRRVKAQSYKTAPHSHPTPTQMPINVQVVADLSVQEPPPRFRSLARAAHRTQGSV